MTNDNNISFTSEQKWASLWTVVFTTLIVLVLLYFKITMERPEISENEIEIAFGDGAEGSPAPSPAEMSEPFAAPPSASSVAEPEANEPQLTAEDPSVAAARAEERRRRQEERRQQLEAQRAEQARIAAEQKKAAERQAETNRINALASRAFSGGGATQGSGPGGGGNSTTPGNPLGQGTRNIDGVLLHLDGRDVLGLIPKPPYVGKQDGQVIVRITVNPQGTVIGADIKLQGTTITDKDIRDACKAAAKRTKFTPNPNLKNNQIGLLTYKFEKN